MLSKYKSTCELNTNIRNAATHWVTDRRTGCSNTITIIYTIDITILKYKVKSSPATKKQDHHRHPVSTYHSRTVYLAPRAIRGWRQETHHRRRRCSSAYSWTGARTQQIITSTTGTPPGGMAKEDNIISDIEADITATSSRKHRHS